MLGLVRAHGPSWLGNLHRKQRSGRIRNNQRHSLHSWRRDWSAQTVPVDSEIITDNESLPTRKSSPELLPQLMPGFVCAHNPCWLDNHHRKRSRCRLVNCRRNRFPSWCFVPYARTVLVDSVIIPIDSVIPVDSIIVTENVVAADLEIVAETASPAEARFSTRARSLLTR